MVTFSVTATMINQVIIECFLSDGAEVLLNYHQRHENTPYSLSYYLLQMKIR